MADVLNGLHDDHHSIARVLRQLNHELETLAEENSPDYELLEDIMRYVTGYPDTHHHPTEDIVFRYLRDRAPDTAPYIDAITNDHQQLLVSGRRFLEAIDAVEHEALVQRDELLARGREYAEMVKRHMETEEGYLFPQAGEKLTDADWDAINSEVEAQTDPLFGPARSAEFQRLWQRITDHTAP